MVAWVRGMIDEIRLNLSPGVLAWALHRVTGVLLAFYLFAHLAVLGTSLGGAGGFDAAMSGLRSPFFLFLESAIVVSIAYHMLNGVRVMIIEFAGLTRQQRHLFQLVLGGSVAVMALTGWVFFKRVLA
jgi:succinate dehydrogenase / fumarate reductase cytochrome b subunit